MLIPPQSNLMEIRVNNVDTLVDQLISFIYPELKEWKIVVSYKSISSFADVSWDEHLKQVAIRCDTITESWPSVALTGLLSHELSHLCSRKQSEEETDLDVVKRGLGVYLAVERIICGKYEDHKISRGKDKYLGYRSIRELLTDNELEQLNRVLVRLNLTPTPRMKPERPVHDVVIYTEANQKWVRVGGQVFPLLKDIKDPDVNLVKRDGNLHVTVNGKEIGVITED